MPVGGTFAAELGWFNGVTADPLQITLLPASITGFGFFGPSFPNATTDGDAGNGAGWFIGPTFAIPGAPSGTVVTFEVFAFNGTSYANSTFNGHSPLFQATLGGGALPPASLITSQNFTVDPVPEPSAFALAGLGAAALIASRHKQQA